MGKLILFFFLINILSVKAFNPDNIFQDDLTLFDSLNINLSGQAHSVRDKEDFTLFLTDPSQKVSDDFAVPTALMDRVRFWFNVYTKYTSHFSVIHDIDNLGIIYDVIDFSDVVSNISNRNTRYAIQNKSLKSIIKEYKSSFSSLSKGKCNTEKCLRILSALDKAKVKIPKKGRKQFFLNLRNKVRTQTGQHDHIRQGLVNIDGYNESIEHLFKVFDLPHELLAVSFLESSFNIHAESKVGATGPWQFMRVIGKHFMKINRNVDQRRSAVLSTAAALHLLKQNKKIMKTWDLAVNAYNSGTGLLRRGVKSLYKKGFKKPRVEHLIDHFQHRNWGFAAKNFYSEFLALVYTLAYRDEILQQKFNLKDGDLDIYLTKCKLPLVKLISTLKSSKHNILRVNNHLKRSRATYPKGTVLISDVNLTSRKYLKIPHNKLKSYYPKNLYKLVAKERCR
ncbi:MAG: hypothetical protein CME60_00420 [Halobacteriovoraceae bacterium]|nr:hypothetical protein [Halobacteriovoraceae bacterium]